MSHSAVAVVVDAVAMVAIIETHPLTPNTSSMDSYAASTQISTIVSRGVKFVGQRPFLPTASPTLPPWNTPNTHTHTLLGCFTPPHFLLN